MVSADSESSPGETPGFSVLTWNLYGGDEFRRQRVPHMVAEILGKRPSLLCLQECTETIAGAIIAGAGSADATTGDENHVNPRYEVVYRKQTALLEHTGLCTSDEVAGKFDWRLPDDFSGLKQGESDPDIELSELFVLVDVNRFEVLSQNLGHVGHWFDDGNIRVRVRSKSNLSQVKGPGGALTAMVVDLYNVHFSGGSFGKPPEVVQRKRKERLEEFDTLNQAINEGDSGGSSGSEGRPDLVLVCGDFNCCPEPWNRELFPEIEQSPEVVFASAGTWEDVGRGLGVTESTSRNLFRSWLKPGQEREARFDRILVRTSPTGAGALTVAQVEMLGTKQVGTAEDSQKAEVPLFCSDHFGLYARFE